MNKDIIKGNWREIKGKVQQKWGQLTNDEVDKMQGNHEELRGAIQKKYGYQKDQAEQEIDQFVKENKWH